MKKKLLQTLLLLSCYTITLGQKDSLKIQFYDTGHKYNDDKRKARPNRSTIGLSMNLSPPFFILNYTRELDWSERWVLNAGINPLMPHKFWGVKRNYAFILETGAKYRFFTSNVPRMGFGVNVSYINNLYDDRDASSIYKKSLTSIFLNPYLSFDLTIFKRIYLSADFGTYTHIYEYNRDQTGPLTKEYIKEELILIPSIKLVIGYEFK